MDPFSVLVTAALSTTETLVGLYSHTYMHATRVSFCGFATADCILPSNPGVPHQLVPSDRLRRPIACVRTNEHGRGR